MSDVKGLVLRGSVLRAAMLFANVAVALYMMPFLVHALGDRWYGMWTLVATFMGYYGYLDFGLSVSVQRFIAGAIGRKAGKFESAHQGTLMLDEIGVLEVVEGSALHGFGAEGEAGRVDDVHPDAEAGAEPQNLAGVLGDVGLVEGKLDRDFGLLRRWSGKARGYSVAEPGREGLSGWTRPPASAKRTPNSRAGEGGRAVVAVT